MTQQIDEAVLSRQLFTIGKDAQIKMMNTKVLIAGLNGMGAEITKNVLLMSVKSVGLLDNRNACLADLGTNFFLRKEHIGHCISESTYKQFQELNNNVPVRVEKRELTDETLYNDYDIIVLCYLLSEKQSIYINELCRKHNVKMVYAVNRGPFTMIFNDFGDNFVVFDSNGETPLTYIVNEVVGNTIQFIDENFCTLDVGNEVQLDEFSGLPGLNYSENGGKTFKITKRTAYSIEIGDLSQYGKYIKGGKVTEKYDINFVNTIQKLITNFPENTITDEGIPFWHAPKRFPHIYPFNIDNQYAKEFIISASLLRAEIYGIKNELSKEEIIKYAYSLKEYTSEEKKTEEPEAEIKQLSEEIKGKEIPKVNPIEFEKDDDNNHHIEFITACSNLRAENYCIKPADFLKTKLIAGKIIPAMITTTAVVSGLQCIELLKVIEKKPLEAYHCSFLNLAIGYMDATEPEAVKKTKICDGLEVSIWDKLEFDGNCTIEQFCQEISKRYPIEVDSITACGALFYCSYLPSGIKRSKQTFKEIYKDIKHEEYKNNTMTIAISVSSEKEQLPDNLEFPDIILNF
ncbi:ubiquitin-activating enzyme E1 1, putative [Entamoeba histolytica HM-1:IMSS]|uniref:Ubiquitin-activating enzyme E1 1, putative n=1 Tax=Entamoeba histolytica (strain ATCC 30459 / HM-1:IMSS / ABRM) TaxID=294381 RepID=B1N360_ENTH1|nr:ubiquitin-activating enzyme E1 1, putative [Entamoeba histolytica HM-1:IMSS]EDS89596.1 ubiquitin-activating enzyme E1 1, putative [Entamoeba histolytica HM-1:IMSS]|eukprot:XP_001913626.1 ubiquitin-activating enzyme E1 1, putative [Entamoeba histolytica HM-1:IMSS]